MTTLKSVLRGITACTVLSVVSPGAGWGDVRDDLVQLEHKRNAVLIAGDWDAYDSMLGDEFFHAHVMGGVLEKTPHVAHLKAGNSKVTNVVLDAVDVRLYGDVAVVTAVSHVNITHVNVDEVARLTDSSVEELTKAGLQFTRHSRYLHVWARRAGDWKLVARQATYLPEVQ